MKELQFEFQCCFCGEGIGESADKFHALDPCAIILIANWQKSHSEQAEQQYFCHLECFKRSVEAHAPVDVEDLAAYL